YVLKLRTIDWLSGISFLLMQPLIPRSTLFPYTTLFRSPSEILSAYRKRSSSKIFGSTRKIIIRERSNHRIVNYFCRRIHFLRLRSEEHTSELQSRENLVCRLLLEKKNE